MGRAREFAGNHPANLFELFDQVELGVEAPGSVNQQHVYAAAFSGLHAIEYHGRWVGARTMLDDIDTNPLSPDVELLDSRGPKRVSRHKQDFFTRAAILRGEFADRRRFANAVDPEKNNHPRLT